MPRPAGFVDQHPGVEPLLLYDAGFQLITLATLRLPLLVPPIARRLVELLRWSRIVPAAETVAELLAVTLAAQIATLPVLVLTYHQISLVAPLANLVTVPLLAPILALGGALALLALAAQVPVLRVPGRGGPRAGLGRLAAAVVHG
jgi:predicted membrane metal-binding protein